MIYYFVKALACLCGLISIYMAFYSCYRPREFERFCDVAAYGYQVSATRNKHKYPLYRVDRLWRCVTLSLGIFGVIYINYGLSNFLFGWMPFIAYGKNPSGDAFLGLITIFFTVGMMIFLSHVHQIAWRQHSKD